MGHKGVTSKMALINCKSLKWVDGSHTDFIPEINHCNVWVVGSDAGAHHHIHVISEVTVDVESVSSW